MKKDDITTFVVYGLLAWVLYALWQKKKQQPKTEESKFFNPGGGGGNTVSYTLNNPTGSTQTVSLFGRTPTSGSTSMPGSGSGSRSLAGQWAKHSRSRVRSMSGSVQGVSVTGGAASLAADIQAHPVKVKSIKVISKNKTQVQAPIQISCSEPTGKKMSYYKRPVISPSSFRDDVVEIKTNNLVLSGACKINYEMQPHSQANVTLNLGKSLGGTFDQPQSKLEKKREALREMKIIQ